MYRWSVLIGAALLFSVPAVAEDEHHHGQPAPHVQQAAPQQHVQQAAPQQPRLITPQQRAVAPQPHRDFRGTERANENFRGNERANENFRGNERGNENFRGNEHVRGDERFRGNENFGGNENFRGSEHVRGREFENRRFARPHVDFDVYARRYSHLPDFRVYRSYGLVAPLASYPDLAFLNDAALVGSYMQDGRVVYVYILDEDGSHREFRVDEYGNILSENFVP